MYHVISRQAGGPVAPFEGCRWHVVTAKKGASLDALGIPELRTAWAAGINDWASPLLKQGVVTWIQRCLKRKWMDGRLDEEEDEEMAT